MSKDIHMFQKISLRTEIKKKNKTRNVPAKFPFKWFILFWIGTKFTNSDEANHRNIPTESNFAWHWSFGEDVNVRQQWAV